MRTNQEQLQLKLRTKKEKEREEKYENEYDDLESTMEDFVMEYGLKGALGLLEAVASTLDLWGEMGYDDGTLSPQEASKVQRAGVDVDRVGERLKKSIKEG